MSEIDDQDAVRIGDTDQHKNAHQRHHVQRGVQSGSITRTPMKPIGMASMIRNGSTKERNCATRIRRAAQMRWQSRSESLERFLHSKHHSRKVHADTRGELRLFHQMVDGPS